MNEELLEHVIVAGNGMSAVACVDELLQSGSIFDITIFGDEPHTNYDRALLPSVLAGERDPDSVILNDIEWYQEHGIRTRLGIRVEEIDPANREVRSSDGDWTGYDKLILATGLIPRIPLIGGLDKAGVFASQTLDDTRQLMEAARPGVRVVVIGGSIADPVARGLRRRGCDVLQIPSGDMGVEKLDVVLGDGRVEGVRFTDGRQVPADLVVIAAGSQPNTFLARNAGLKVSLGIVVNDRMETSDPHIFAIGGCAEQGGHTFDSFPPVLEQAKVLAANLVSSSRRRFKVLNPMVREFAGSPIQEGAK